MVLNDGLFVDFSDDTDDNVAQEDEMQLEIPNFQLQDEMISQNIQESMQHIQQFDK